MVFENGVKYIQAAAYNGARTVHRYTKVCLSHKERLIITKNKQQQKKENNQNK